MKKNLAVITARGGSKRIPHKNIKDFLGKPIIAYSIEAALKSNLFSEVMVSTDDSEIAKIAERYGANVPFMRSAKNSDDFATTEDVLREVLNEYKLRGKNFEWLCCLYPTAPFVTASKLISAMQCLLSKNGCGGLVPVVKFSYPPQRGFIINDANYLEYKWKQYIRSRSQDLEPFYHDAGQFYFYRADLLINSLDDFLLHTIPFFVDELEVQDIDSLTDWKIAEMKYRLMNKI